MGAHGSLAVHGRVPLIDARPARALAGPLGTCRARRGFRSGVFGRVLVPVLRTLEEPREDAHLLSPPVSMNMSRLIIIAELSES
jgi:hypothetical protein